ncbi:MAG: TIGR03084 family metal-binding protein [Pseudomonadota bacterium]
MQQAEDFWQESLALAAILDPLSEQAFATVTQFKAWTIQDVIGHLHLFNHAANLSLSGGDHFQTFFEPIRQGMDGGRSLVEIQYDWLGDLGGRALFDAWYETSKLVAENFSAADPKARLKWAGPEMSARSFISARQMEVWAHGQEIFDILGAERPEHDRVRNIAHLGVTAYGWTFINRKREVPQPAPYLKLTAPSGAIWEWNDPDDRHRLEGSAVEFCQVVTQVRNIADTSLVATGENAERWMAMAQCFAGQPEDPPAPGTRYRVA